MTRPKGSKNKPKIASPVEEKGNPIFNINDVEPSQTLDLDNEIAPTAILPEDLEFERNLQTIYQPMERISDPEPIGMTPTAPKDLKGEMLGDLMINYKPASTDDELRTQVQLAKVEGCDSIEATLDICKRYCKDPKLEDVGYFTYYNVKIYISGQTENAKHRDSMTVEQKVHRMGIST